jgi:hypothetical protein
MSLRPLALLVACALVAAMTAGEADARPKRLGAEEVKALLSGNTLHGFNPNDDSTYTMFHSSDGTVRAELRNVSGTVSRSDGRWSVSDQGKLCIEWENLRWINSCATVTRDDDAITFLDDNRRVISFGEVAVGNPDDI